MCEIRVSPAMRKDTPTTELLVQRPRKEARRGGPGLGGTDPWGGRVGKRTYWIAVNVSNLARFRKSKVAIF